MKRIVLGLVILLSLSACSKSDDADFTLKYNENLEGKEFITHFNALLDYSIEFYKPGEIRYISKNKGSGTVNSMSEYQYFKWEKTGTTGMDILVTIPASESGNLPERKIRGYVLEKSLTFTDLPLKGAYDLRIK